MPEVVGPHRGEYYFNGPEVLIGRALIDGDPPNGQNACANALEEDLEEGDGFINTLEVGGDAEPAKNLHHCRQAGVSSW